MSNLAQTQSKFRISRRGRKLQLSDDQRTLFALPKEVPERTWAEILQKEDNELLVFDIREEIVENALKIGYVTYMEKQTSVFSVCCATEAWLKLIDWHFYRHDPGEETSAYPPCYIPKREESWIPDERPDPSPKDTWGKHSLNVVEDTPDTVLQKWPSSSSLDFPVIEEIPSEYWAKKPQMVNVTEKGGVWEYVQDSYSARSATTEELNTESEVLQKVTDYSTEGLSEKESSPSFGEPKTTMPVEDESVQGSLRGAGDSTISVKHKRRPTEPLRKSTLLRPGSKSKATLPPIDLGDSRSRISIISDCRLRNLRLETQYEITSEKVDTPPGEIIKRK